MARLDTLDHVEGTLASTTGTDVAVVERYRGPIAPIIGKRLPDLQPGLDAFVAGWREAS